jgi:rubrerythrin
MMSKQYDSVEFFKMMVANEKAVAALYRQFAGDTKLGDKFFESLAKDEDRHFDIYSALLKKHSGGKDLTVEVSDEDEKYLKLLIENNMLKDADKLLQKAAKITDKDQIFDLAERSERDSVLFVKELMGLFPNLQPADFKIILKEEKDHLTQVLSRRMESKLSTLRL